MEEYKITCLKILNHIQYKLSYIRDEIEINGDGYESKLDKETRSIEKKVNKLIEHFNKNEGL